MALVKLDEIEPGMELAAPVENRQGRVLVNTGVLLTEGMLEALRNWDIAEVQVVSRVEAGLSASGETLTSPSATETTAEQELRDRFCKTDLEDPVVQELFRLALQSTQQVNNPNDA